MFGLFVTPNILTCWMKSSTLPDDVNAAKLSNSVLVLLPPNILSSVVAKSSQELFLEFCHQNLNQCACISFHANEGWA